MAVRPEHFFTSTPFVRWTLIPALLLFAISIPVMMDQWTLGRALLVTGLSTTAVLYAGALAWPSRLRWAGRAVAGLVFVFYAIYAIDQWFFSEAPFVLVEPRSSASPRNALLGLLVIGVPSLIYALRRRTTTPVSDGGDHSHRDDAQHAREAARRA